MMSNDNPKADELVDHAIAGNFLNASIMFKDEIGKESERYAFIREVTARLIGRFFEDGDDGAKDFSIFLKDMLERWALLGHDWEIVKEVFEDYKLKQFPDWIDTVIYNLEERAEKWIAEQDKTRMRMRPEEEKNFDKTKESLRDLFAIRSSEEEEGVAKAQLTFSRAQIISALKLNRGSSVEAAKWLFSGKK